MKYAIEVLEKESDQLKKCLSEWDLNNHPEARKQRSDKLKSLEKAIRFLKSNEIFESAVEGKTI